MSTVNAIIDIQDEIIKACEKCHSERVIGYWDYELESYIYLEDEPKEEGCSHCNHRKTLK